MTSATAGQPTAPPSADMAGRVLDAKRRDVGEPFRALGFTKIEYSWREDTGVLEYDIDDRLVGNTNQRIQGHVNPAERGVVVGTIELIERTEPDNYAGYYELGNGKRQVPEHVAQEAWAAAVKVGRRRWEAIAAAKPKDTLPAAPLTVANRQNELIYGLVLLAHDVVGLTIDKAHPFTYVAHQHVSSPDGHLVMVYGGAKHWTGGEVSYSVETSSADEGFLALLGITNASFVEHLITQFGNRLGITRLASIVVRNNGLDVYWMFA
jgi:hypothetical protein